jgi:hypothetical protein
MSRLLIPNGSRGPLGEGEAIEILHHHMNGLGPVEIGARLHRTKSTISSFLKSSKKSRAIVPHRGRPVLPSLLDSTIDDITGQLDREPRLALRRYEKMPTEFPNLRKTRLWELRHQQGYHLYKEIEICDITPEHKMARVRLCAGEIDDPIKIPIMFTDESKV